MTCIEKIQVAVQGESVASNLDGWLFTDFGNRDEFTGQLLSIPNDMVSTRRWVYIVAKDGIKPVKILHIIEPDSLSHLPCGNKFFYSSHQELFIQLRQFSGKTFAVLCDPKIPVISTMDGGFVDLLHRAGIKTVSAANVIQRSQSLLSPAKINSHERASLLLHKIVLLAWNFICERYNSKKTLHESDVCTFIMEKFLDYGLTTNHPPIIAFGKNTSNPHYCISPAKSTAAQEGDVIQLDIWAKERIAIDDEQKQSFQTPVYADISFVGVYSTKPTTEQEKVFGTIALARDAVVLAIQDAAKENNMLTGAQLDEKARQVLQSHGYGQYIKHRTGHGIDTNCHGSGVNLDSSEFPDTRKILPGSCFSVEPGIYTEDFGMRTEINVYITADGNPIISGNKFNQNRKGKFLPIPQKKLLTTKDVFNDNNN